MKRNLKNLIRKTIKESQLLLEKKLPCDKRSKKGCTECMDDYFDAHDAGNPSEPLYGVYGVCGGGKVVDPSNDDWEDRRRSKSAGPETRFDFEDELRINESNLLSERMDCWSRGKWNRGGCRIDSGNSSSGCMSYNECEKTEEGDRVFGRKCCITVDMNNECVEYGPCGKGKSSEKLSREMNEQIERIVKEQAMMLGFGNSGGPGVGFETAVATPTSKYEQYEEEEYELDETSGSGEGGTYNINISNQSADPAYTADGMGMFESIIRRKLRNY